MIKNWTMFLVLAAASALAGEGMWLPQQVPFLANEVKGYKLKFNLNEMGDLNGPFLGAVVSLGGCTASFVSPDGLLITNHHCAFGAIQANSTPERDLITTGYLAKTRGDELPAPGQRAWITTNMEDVTARVVGNFPPNVTDADRARTMEQRRRTLVAECEKPGGVKCRVDSFFEGAQYLRSTMTELSDVRLVYAPPNSVGDFGGDVDNFRWPRHAGDFSFFRVYQNGQPYHPAHWLKVSTADVNDAELVFVPGYPARTFRYTTAAEVQAQKEFTYPTSIRYFSSLIDALETAGKNDRAVQIRNASRIKSLNNSLKYYQDVLKGFDYDRIVEARQWRERQVRNAMMHDAKLAPLAPAFAAVDQLDAKRRERREQELLLQWIVGGRTYRSSPLLTQAFQTYRAAVERKKKPEERAEGYSDTDIVRLKETSDRLQRIIDVPSDRAGLRLFLLEAAKLPANERLKAIDDAVAAAGSVDALLDRLYGTTKVADAAARAAMLRETPAQLTARHDAMIDFAASLLPAVEANEARELEIAGAMSRVRPSYFDALKRVAGGNVYSDANGTLRVSLGTLIGYNGGDAVWFQSQTTIRGVYAKTTGKEPFDSPERLLEAARSSMLTTPYKDPQLDAVPVDFISTADTTGGNSGSPTINANGELCGLLFDGNEYGTDSDFFFTPPVRSIHVDMKYVLWILDAVEHANDLMREMGVTPQFAR